MFDCANVEIRELLPDFVAGTVDTATRARVADHLAGCAECASEVETLRLVRSAFAAAPAIDLQRVVSALPKPPVVVRGGRDRAPVKRWVDWRIAAALTTITVGALSVAVANRRSPSVDGGVIDTSEAVVSRFDSQAVPGPTVTPQPHPKPPVRLLGGRDTVRPASTKAQLSFGGGVADLDDESIRALLGALEEIDRAPVAPSAEPDPTPVLPVIKDGKRSDR